jgi:vesicle coat complex subunit
VSAVDAIKLSGSSRFFEKRMGYLILSVLLDAKDELLTLIPNSLNNDLASANSWIISIALSAASCVADADTFRQILPQIEALLSHEHTYIKKKAILCVLTAVRRDRTLGEIFAPKLPAMLTHRSHAIIIAAVCLLTDLLVNAPELVSAQANVC